MINSENVFDHRYNVCKQRQNKIKADEPTQGTQQKWKYWLSHGQADDVENKVYLETED